MTSTPTPSEQEGIEYLATKVMGWHWGKPARSAKECWMNSDNCCHFDWDCTNDWNCFRMVEEKVMEDERLAYRYCSKLIGEQWKNCEPMTVDSRQKGYVSRAMIIAMKADLPTRCTALIAAHKALYPSP